MKTGDAVVPLHTVLKDAELLEYHDKMKSVLKLRHAGDLEFTEEKDLLAIGMSRPEQKRLRKEYAKHFPQSGMFVKLRKVFGRTDGRNSDYVNPTSTAQDDEQKHVIPANHIQLQKELGVGEFGHVYLAAWTQSTSGEILQVAVKRVLPEKLITNPSSFLQEAAIMTKMRHENVVRLFGVVLDTKSVMLVSELAPCGSLLECCQNPALRNSFPVDVLCSFGLQIAKGMQYLAAERLIHRDLAARNVLVFSAEKVKISDFGLSRSLGVGEDYYRSEFSPTMKLPIAWCAPESINFLRFTEKSDVWSFGVTLWEMFSYGEMPWLGYTGAQILTAVDRKNERLACPRACPAEFYGVMTRCWEHDAEERPCFDQLVSIIPDVMPQLLVAVSDVDPVDEGHLCYKRNDIIILINRNPTGSKTQSDLWLGGTRNGQIGLFNPSDTVAYLGAELPSSNAVLPATKHAVSVKKKDLKKEKGSSEKKKLLISEPQGEVVHTCHVGIDGTSFGLLQVDKNELGRAFSTFSVHSDVAAAPPRPAPRKVVANGVRHISSEKAVSIDELHPSHPSSPSAEGSLSPHSPAGSTTSGTTPPVLLPRKKNDVSPVPPPALPPKPHRTTSALVIENPRAQICLTSANSLNRRTVGENVLADFHKRREQLAKLGQDLNAGGSTMTTSTTMSSVSSSPESVLDQVLHELQADISHNFSVQTTSTTLDSLDFSDTRPLIPDSPSSNGVAFPQSPPKKANGSVAYMDESQFTNFRKRADEEHKKAEKQLERQRTLDRKASEKQLSKSMIEGSHLDKEKDKPLSNGAASILSVLTNRSQSTDGPALSPRAQAAYDTLVQCGNRLKSTTSPTPPEDHRASSEESQQSSASASSTATALTVIAGSYYSRASAPPLSPAGTLRPKSPPPPPPKPKLRTTIQAHRIAIDDYMNTSSLPATGLAAAQRTPSS